MKTCIIAKENKHLVRVLFADSFFYRLRGIIGRKLGSDEGLMLSPCNQVHCFFVSYPIDVIYISNSWTVIHIDEDMKPNTIGKRVRHCKHVLELHAGESKRIGIQVGDRLSLLKEA